MARNILDLRGLLEDDGRDVAKDTGLLGDLDQGVAEDVLVVASHVGDRGDLGADDVGRVESTPESGLDDRDVDRLLREVRTRRRS